MKKRLAGFVLMGLLMAVLACGCTVAVGVAPPPPGSEHRVVTVNAVNLRACPSARCEVLSVLYRGDRVTVHEYSNNWARVTVPRSGGLAGWMDASLLGMP